jgi:hypothetical protein
LKVISEKELMLDVRVNFVFFYFLHLKGIFRISFDTPVMYDCKGKGKGKGKGKFHPTTGHEGPEGSSGMALLFP